MNKKVQIELKAQRYLYERAHLSRSCVVTTFDPFDVEQAFIDGAEWQKKQLIEKAWDWIDYNNRNGGCNFDGWEEDFKKAMED